MFNCCICHYNFKGNGHDAKPYMAYPNKCCNYCNDAVVTPLKYLNKAKGSINNQHDCKKVYRTK